MELRQPITQREPVTTKTEYIQREYTYQEMLDTFDNDETDNWVVPLVKRCMAYETEIERLQDIIFTNSIMV